MKLYDHICRAEFLERPNRFIARCRLEGSEVLCHVKNTGRCRELLLPQAEVYLNQDASPRRKTAYDLVAVRKGSRLVNLDSQAPNRVFREWALGGAFLPGLKELQPERPYGDSRFDSAYRTENSSGFVEVKGVTLEEDGVAYFPDAPTQRGVRHVEALIRAAAEGYGAWLCFVVALPGVSLLRPNDRTHPAFGEALRRAQPLGVKLLALGCQVEPEGFSITHRIPIRL